MGSSSEAKTLLLGRESSPTPVCCPQACPDPIFFRTPAAVSPSQS